MLYAHLRIAAFNSGDTNLVSILGLKDSHAFVTSKMLALDGKDYSVDYCADHKKDPEIAYYRSIAKVATYTQFNDGSASTFLNSLLKSFVDVSLEDCQKAKDALSDAFPGYQAYAAKLKAKAYRNIVENEHGEFVQYRTHDGRLFHVEVRDAEYNGKPYKKFKLGEITSSMLISPEALAMKQAMVEILDFLRANRDLPIKLNSMTHD